jgi:hypothetical protein
MIATLLSKEHSKRNTLAIVDYIGDDPTRLKELIAIFKTSDLRLIQRAAWPLSYIAEKHPKLITPHLGELLKLLNQPLHVAFRRNIFRFLRLMPEIPKKHHATIIEASLLIIPDNREPGAVRAFAMYTMAKLALIYPELNNEFSLVLQPLVQHPLPSVGNTAAKILRQMASK